MRPTSTLFAILLLMLVSAAAYAAEIRSSITPKRVQSVRKTVTSGRICKKEPCHIETFSGGYFFKGRVRPSARGQKVYFAYRRVSKTRWHRFGKGSSSKKVFVVTDGTTYDRVNRRGYYRELIDINGFTGYPHRKWILRATFPPQGRYLKSAAKVRVRAAYGD